MTPEESFANYHAVLNEKIPIDKEAQAVWKTATKEQKNEIVSRQIEWKKQHDERVEQARHALIPYVGLPCTIVYYSDYRAATVSRIITDKKIAVRHNLVKCIDYFAGTYEILPELDEHEEEIFTKRSNGLWCMEGQASRDGVLLMLHYQRHYIDPHY